MEQPLCVYQAVRWQGNDYLLTRLGFGLTSAPKIMTKIMESVIELDLEMKNSVTSHIDDLCINEDIIKAEKVRDKFEQWGLLTKECERVDSNSGLRILGLWVNSD